MLKKIWDGLNKPVTWWSSIKTTLIVMIIYGAIIGIWMLLEKVKEYADAVNRHLDQLDEIVYNGTHRT